MNRFDYLAFAAVLVLAGSASAQETAPPPPEAPPVEGTVVPVVDQSQVPDPYAQPGGTPPPAAPGYGQQQPAYGQPTVVMQAQTPGVQPRRHRVPYSEGMQVPPGANIITRRRIGLLIPGAILFGISYISTIMAWTSSTVLQDRHGGGMLVPAVGPFIAYPNGTTLGRPFLIFDGLLQTAGLAMFIVGLLPVRYIEYWADQSRPGFAVAPTGNGLELNYRF